MSIKKLPDPRWSTDHAMDHTGSFFHERPYNTIYLPPTVNEVWCRPGYQPKRPNKGTQLTVNDYPFHHIQYGGPKWASVVNTPFQTDN